ncbi:ADP-ribose pyrophosphatase [Corynebacterium atrinae]|uniref:NUDIX domain-containing protein n=1 Tax=Corynebacterium atrinae TaxID=1336740 RepID=UPI0025B28EBE|nr:NUDIX hydrolase [Corynebacterium atrinae]WJY63304.1 ADP-ribose pyrophosphatase [Corynebacterium atrinae]
MVSRSHEFSVHGSEVLLESPILAVRQDRVLMPGGTLAKREIVEHFGAVAVVAVDDRGRLPLVQQYRHSIGRRLWELPAGLLDMAGEDELTGAQRELEEEAGLVADSWSVLVDLVTSPGFCDESVRVFLATALSEVGRPPSGDDEEADMATQWVSVEQAVSMIMSGEIVNSIAIAGIFAAAEVLAGRSEARPVSVPFDLRPASLAQRRIDEGIAPDMKMLPR